jgi:hypothetical protein
VRASSLGFALLVALALVSRSEHARAFCRTTTCGPGECQVDPACSFCLIGGKPLYWPRGCVSYSVQSGGSKLRGIGAATLKDFVTSGFENWISAACPGGGTPGVAIYDFGFVSCDAQEYNQDDGNANIWLFRDNDWPYVGVGTTLALTTLTFNVESGEIYDADVEINSFENPITIDDVQVQADLASIVVHEAGHFLGLSHSCDSEATMFAAYQFGDTKLRSLELDDVTGICTIYPPGSNQAGCNPEPRHGYSRDCGSAPDEGCCTTAPGAPRPLGTWAIGVSLLGAGLLAARRRVRKR